MSLARALVESRSDDVGGRWERYFSNVLAQLRTASSVSVTPEKAMQVSVFFDCVRVIAEDEAKLPLMMYERVNEGKTKADDHPVFSLVHSSPNPEMTSMELRETVVGHMVGRGNGYIFRQEDKLGRPIGLWPLLPTKIERMSMVNNSGVMEKWWEYELPNGQKRRLLDREVIHLRGFGFDGEKGYNPAIQGREGIGRALAVERYGAKFFANDATPRVVLKSKKSFKDDKATKNIRESWENRVGGLDNSHLVAILEEDMDIQVIGASAETSQMLGTEEHTGEDICRWFRMPPHKVGLLRRATFSNIEHQALEYVTDTLMPWMVRVEQRLSLDLLTPKERQSFFFEHKVQALLRGDYKTRMEGYRIGREISLYSTNDCLSLENMNKIGPEGDVRHIPLNWVELGADPDTPARSSGGDRTRRNIMALEHRKVDEQVMRMRLRLRGRYRGLIHNAATAVVRREVADIGRAARKLLAKRDRESFEDWLRDFYADHPAFIREKLLPVLRSYAEAIGDTAAEHMGDDYDADQLLDFVADYTSGDNGRAERYASMSLAHLMNVLERAYEEDNDPLEAIEGELEHWDETRADKWADREQVQAGDAFAYFVYATFYSITRWRWNTTGSESCPYCERLNHTIVGTGEPFIAKGEAYGDNLEEGPLTPTSDVRHAPAHNGCDCILTPVTTTGE